MMMFVNAEISPEMIALAEDSGRNVDSTRNRLLAAAAEVFAERGYDGTRVQEIARRAGLTTGAIYANFSGKTDLLLEAVRQYGGQQLEELLQGGQRDKSTLDLLTDLGTDLATSADRATSELLFEAFAAARRDPQVGRFLTTQFKKDDGRLHDVIERIRGEGMLADDIDIDTAVRFCHALVIGVLVLDAMGFDPPDRSAWSTLIQRVASSFASSPASRL